MDCVFCKMLEDGVPTFGTSNHFVCRLDIHPVSPGHALIIPRSHVESVAQLSVPQWKELQKLVKLLGNPFSWYPKAWWEQTYRQMREKKITVNSVWFIDQALAHPRLGERPDGFNHVVNDGEVAGQTVRHLHWHVIPRYRGDVRDPSGGGRYVIPKMGNYKKPRTSQFPKVQSAGLQGAAQEARRQLQGQ